MPRRSPFALLGDVFAHASAKRRAWFVGTLILMIASATLELAAIGSVVPFLALAGAMPTTGASALLVNALAPAAKATGLGAMQLATALLVGLALSSALLRLVLAWTSQKLIYDVGHDISTKIFRQVLHQPYSYHLLNNSNHLNVGIYQVHAMISGCLLPAMLALTSAVVAAFIVAGLLVLDPMVAVLSAIGLTLIYSAIALVTKPRLRANSKSVAAEQTSHMLVLREGLGGIRDVLLGRSQDVFADAFARADRTICDRRAENQFLFAAPRFIIEAAGVILIAAIGIYVSARPQGFVGSLPVLGALAVGAQRLLPMAQQIYNGYAAVLANGATIENVLQFLENSAPDDDTQKAQRPLPPLASRIKLNDVSFRYPTMDRNALDAISLDIASGSRIGLIGETGSGKSTFVDVLMGLLPPSGGTISVDGVALDTATVRAWQSQIAHVPQSIYLSDSSIAANIAFGLEPFSIDMDRVREAARRASLDTFIGSLPDGYDTLVGEGGVRLSGGQRQRIGIARALYRDARILVLDEATSALDDTTEAEVMRAIADVSKHLTMIIVAHRLTTLAICDRIVRLHDGRIVETGTYDDMIRHRIAASVPERAAART